MTVSVVPLMLCDPPPVTLYELIVPLGAVHVTVAVVAPVTVATTLVGAFGSVDEAAIVPTVPDPAVPTGVSVNPPYDVLAARAVVFVGKFVKLSVYDVPVIPVTVVNPVPESVNDVAPAAPPHPKVNDVVALEVIENPVTGAGTVVTAPNVADAVDPFVFTDVSVNGPYVVPPLVAKLYDVPVSPVFAGTIL